MRKSSVRVISLDRRRSGIVDRSDPMHSEWRVFFSLRPRPIREWDRHFEQLSMQAQQRSVLKYNHRLIRESRGGGYYFAPRRHRFWAKLFDLFSRRDAFGIEVICPSRAEDLHQATHEVARMVAKTNLSYVQSEETNRASLLAARVATDRLVNALDSVEKQLKKKALQLEAAKVTILGENVVVGAE